MSELKEVAGILEPPETESQCHAIETLPAILDAAQFVSIQEREPPQLVRGLLHQGSKFVLVGGSKSYKTWTLLDLAMSVSHGLDWLGHRTAYGKVLYINFEIQDYAWRERIKAITKAKGIRLKENAVKIWNLRGHGASSRRRLPQIIERTAEEGYGLIILDPIYKLYGDADENKAGDVANVLNGMEELAEKTGAAVAYGAHFSKGNQSGKESIDRISGSGVFARDPDSILVMTPHETEGAFTIEATLRNFAPMPAFCVRWQFPLFHRDEELDPAKLKKKAGCPKKHTAEKILSILKGSKLTSAEWQKRAELEGGVSKSRFYALLPEAKKLPQLTQDEKGRWCYAVHEE